MPPTRQPWDPTALTIYAALRRSADLRKSVWRELGASKEAHFTTGHCYIATEAWYHTVGRAEGFVPHVTRIGEGTHWWCQHPDGRVMDLTFEQFPQEVDYTTGRGTGFLTSQPSKRACVLLDRAGLTPPTLPKKKASVGRKPSVER